MLPQYLELFATRMAYRPGTGMVPRTRSTRRLVSSGKSPLTGPAKRLILREPAGWLSHPDGVPVLLEYLRSCLGRPQVSELSDFLNKYFRHGHRKPEAGESMSDCVTRKCEMYLRAQQALQRVKPLHGGTSSAGGIAEPATGTQWESGRRSSWDSSATQTAPQPKTAIQRLQWQPLQRRQTVKMKRSRRPGTGTKVTNPGATTIIGGAEGVAWLLETVARRVLWQLAEAQLPLPGR